MPNDANNNIVLGPTTITANGKTVAVSPPGTTATSTGNAELTTNILRGIELHASTRDLTFRLIDDGMKPSKVVEVVRGLMNAMPDKGEPGRWQPRFGAIQHLVNDAATKLKVGIDTTTTTPGNLQLRKPGMASTWKLDHIGVLLAQPSLPDWLVRGLCEVNTLTCMFGASGAAKTFVVVDKACCVGTGLAYHGHKVKQGAVVYLAGEGHHGLRRRFHAWSIEHDIDLSTAPIYVSSAAIDLAGNHNLIVDAVRVACGDMVPVLVVADTLHRHLEPGAQENDSDVMEKFVAAADAIRRVFGCAVDIVHHTGHAATDRERGSSVLRAALDWSYQVQHGEKGPVIVTCRKAKDFDEPEPMQFALSRVELSWRDEEGDIVTSAVLRPTEKTEAGMGANQLLAMMSLKRLVNEGERVTVDQWRTASNVDCRRWRELLTTLTERGEVLVDEGFVSLP